MYNGNSEGAIEYLAKEIKDNPDNAYAYYLIALVKAGQEENGLALGAANTAIKRSECLE